MKDIDREEEALLDGRSEKSREDLKPVFVLMENGEELEAFTMSDAATYLGMKRAGLNLVLNRLKKEGRPVQVYGMAYGGIERYLLKKDLDGLRTVRPIE